MPGEAVSPMLRRIVAARAGYACEYCLIPQLLAGGEMQIDHIIPVSKVGSTHLRNLCSCCTSCNRFKGARTMATDPVNGSVAHIYDPRAEEWGDHFRWSDNGLVIVGATPTGRATTRALCFNRLIVVAARRMWVRQGLHPMFSKGP